MRALFFILGFIIGSVIFSGAFFYYYNTELENFENKIVVLNTANSTLLEEKLKEKSGFEKQISELNNLIEAETQAKEKNLLLLEAEKNKLADLKNIARLCFWANEFHLSPSSSILHFGGNDYSDYYFYECSYQANNDWNLLID